MHLLNHRIPSHLAVTLFNRIGGWRDVERGVRCNPSRACERHGLHPTMTLNVYDAVRLAALLFANDTSSRGRAGSTLADRGGADKTTFRFAAPWHDACCCKLPEEFVKTPLIASDAHWSRLCRLEM